MFLTTLLHTFALLQMMRMVGHRCAYAVCRMRGAGSKHSVLLCFVGIHVLCLAPIVALSPWPNAVVDATAKCGPYFEEMIKLCLVRCSCTPPLSPLLTLLTRGRRATGNQCNCTRHTA